MSSERVVLEIRQSGPITTKPSGYASGAHFWNLSCKLYSHSKTFIKAKDVKNFREPFTSAEYDYVATYLDTALDDANFDQYENDRKYSKKIDIYRKDLFDGLGLSDFAEYFNEKCVEIQIWTDQKQESAMRTIHCIEWEHLEVLSLWTEAGVQGIRSVAVSRHIHVGESEKAAANPRGQTRHHNHSDTYDVLLVVARTDVHKEPHEFRDILNPGTVRGVLLRVQEELYKRCSLERIRLEVVRPGSLAELGYHLRRRESIYGGRRPYHVVHFDMHGVVENGNAYLRFNKYTNDNSGTLITNDEKARDVAKLLRWHNIDCVILNACQTAIAHKGPSANLSSIFLKLGISAVLSMSHKMHDSMSYRLYSVLYDQLFIQHAPLERAASEARKSLFSERTRYNYNKSAFVKMQDWFIPVVYTSSGKPYFICQRRFTLFRATFGLLSALEWLFIAITLLSIIFYTSVVHLITTNLWSRFSNLAPAYKGLIIFAPACWSTLRIVFRRCRDLRLRQCLEILAQDRQNGLRIEAALRKRNIVLIRNEDNKELSEDKKENDEYQEIAENLKNDRLLTDYSGTFIDCLAAIWKRTHFVAFRGAISAEWFIQPSDLDRQAEWALWIKARINVMHLWIYDLGSRHFNHLEKKFLGSTGAKSVVIVEKLDLLYPKEIPEETYVRAQARFESWLRKHFRTSKDRVPPYLIFTVLNAETLGNPNHFHDWLKTYGPGRSGVLDSLEVTLFTKTSQAHKDRLASLFNKKKRYDPILTVITGDVRRRGLRVATWDMFRVSFENIL